MKEITTALVGLISLGVLGAVIKWVLRRLRRDAIAELHEDSQQAAADALDHHQQVIEETEGERARIEEASAAALAAMVDGAPPPDGGAAPPSSAAHPIEEAAPAPLSDATDAEAAAGAQALADMINEVF